MNNSQRQAMNTDMGQTRSKQRSSVAEADSVRLAQAKLLGAELGTQAGTIEVVCDTLRAEAQKKQKAYEFAAAERTKQEALITKIIQSREQMEQDLETQEQAQQALIAKVELARQNTEALAALYNLVSTAIEAEASMHHHAQMHWDGRAAEAAQLRSALQAFKHNFTAECEQLRQLAAEERSAALSQARKCAELESETAYQARQMAQTLAKNQSRNLKLVSALAADKAAVAATLASMDEQQCANQSAIVHLRDAINSAKAEEQRLLAQLAAIEKIGREFQRLTALFEAGQSVLAQTKSRLRTERAEVDALTSKLQDVDRAASAATQESAVATQQAAEWRVAVEQAERELRSAEQQLHDKEAQYDAEDRRTTQRIQEKEAAVLEVVAKRAEEEKLVCQLNKEESALDELLANFSGVTSSREAVEAARAQKTAECNQLQETLLNKKASLSSAVTEKAKCTLSLDAAETEQKTMQTAHAAQAGLLSTAQESLRVSNKDRHNLGERLAALQTLQLEQCAHEDELESKMSSVLSANVTLKSELVALEQRKADGESALGQRQARLVEEQASQAQLVLAMEAASKGRQTVIAALEEVQVEIRVLAKEKEKDAYALQTAKDDLQAKDEDMGSVQAELSQLRVKVSEGEDLMAAIQTRRFELDQRHQRCADVGARLQVELASAKAAEQDVANQLAVAEADSLMEERANAELRAGEQLQKLAVLASALDLAMAQERTSVDARALQLASATKKAAITSSQRSDSRRSFEADIERFQVTSIRLKRSQRVAKARVRKLEKAIAGVDEKKQASMQRQEENAKLVKEIASSQDKLVQQKAALANELKFLENLHFKRNAEKRALRLEVRNAEMSVNNLLVEAGQTPKSCLKSPKSPVSPSSENKRVTFSSQSEVKTDSQFIQKVPTKRTSKTANSQTPKKARDDFENKAASQESPKRPTKKRPGKKSISPKSNPFELPQIIEHDTVEV